MKMTVFVTTVDYGMNGHEVLLVSTERPSKDQLDSWYHELRASTGFGGIETVEIMVERTS